MTPEFCNWSFDVLLIATLERDCITERSNKIIKLNGTWNWKKYVLLTGYHWSFSLVFFEKKIHISLSQVRSSASRVTTHGFVRINPGSLHVRCVTNTKTCVYSLISTANARCLSKNEDWKVKSDQAHKLHVNQFLKEIEANPARHKPRPGQS